MGMIEDDSNDEYERELKLAVEQYKNNGKPKGRKDGEKNEVVQVKKRWPKGPKGKGKVLKDYENQGAIPKAIYNEIKSNEMLSRDYSNDGKKKLRKGRNSSQLPDPKRQLNEKSVTGGSNSGLDCNVPNDNTSNKNVEVSKKFWKSFYYLVPPEPSPDFCLPPGCYYVVSRPIELAVQTVVVCHPERLEKDSPKDGSKAGKHNTKQVENYAVTVKNVNDISKGERNCSNVTLVGDLISDYNSGKCKGDILSKIKTLKSDLEAEIEAFKSALMESTMALDQLITLEFSLNYKMSSDKKLGNKDMNMKENIKGAESCEENDVEVSSSTENCLVSKEDSESESCVENSPTNEELTPAQEERVEEDTLLSETQDVDEPAEGEQDVLEDEIAKKILEITSVLPDISRTYLRTELEKMGDDDNSIDVFVDSLFEGQEYPKIEVDPDEDERKRLWKEYVTDFNPKKFLFELSIVSPKGAATSDRNDDDDINLVLSFLRRRYPNQPLTDLRHAYETSKNVAEVCKSYDRDVVPVRLSESGFREEKFDKEFLLKVTYLDHEQEIDDYLSGIQDKRNLEREEAKLCNAFLHCITCLNEIVPSETTTCSEGHVFCSNCVERYIGVELGKGIYKFKCFSGDCDGLFDHKTLEELLPASVLLKISMKQQVDEIMEAKVEGLESCSSCHFAYIPDPDDKIFKCQNPACMAEICRICHERSHIPLRCSEVERPEDVEARKKIEEVMTNTLIRRCPSCQRKIVKIDGCNKMTCVCGIFFCYLCQKQIYDYEHFNLECPLRSDDRELHVQRVEEAGIQARNELLGADGGVRSSMI